MQKHEDYDMNADLMPCILCGENSGRIVGQKGVASLKRTSTDRNGELLSKLENSIDNFFVHDNCYKQYTSKFYVSKTQAGSSSSLSPCKKKLRSIKEEVFNYKTHCLICAEKN